MTFPSLLWKIINTLKNFSCLLSASGTANFNPVDADAAAFHSAEPGHLAFGKLVDGGGEGLLHLVEAEFAGEIEGDEFVLKAVVDEVFGRDGGSGGERLAGERVGVRGRAFEEAADFIDHTFAQAGVKTSVDAGVAELAGD